MKTLTYTLFFILLFAACNNGTENTGTNVDTTAALGVSAASIDSTIVIGDTNGDTLSFVADAKVLRDDWESYLNTYTGTKDYLLNEVQLLAIDGRYYMQVTGAQNNKPLRATIALHKSETGCLYLFRETNCCVAMGTYAEEPKACMPQGSYCTHGSDKNITCMKSISSSPVLFFPNIAMGGCSK